MIRVLITLMALGLTACAHERTELDRELALKLVDRAGRVEIIQSGGPVVAQQPVQPVAQQPTVDDLIPQTCSKIPQYSLNGQYLYTAVKCW